VSKTIEIRDAGPIERLSIPIPAAGGIVVLRGCNGSGKTIACQAVQALVADGERPPSRDGSLGALVEGMGARLTIGRRVSVSGELEVSSLEGEDPSLLVDPGIKAEAAADVARIKALLRLSRATVDASAFAPLVGSDEQLRELCRPASLEQTGDVPAMAAAIKRDIEAAARKAEQQAENYQSKAAGVRATLQELGAGPVVQLKYGSAEEARAAHTQAVREHTNIEAARKHNAELRRLAETAQVSLQALGIEGTAPTIETAREQHQARVAAHDQVRARIDELRHELKRLESELGRAQAEAREAEAALLTQERIAKQRKDLEDTISQCSGFREITEDEVGERAARVRDASAELENWAVREKTERVRAEVLDLEQRARAAAEAGAELRAAAAGTERVVLDAVRRVCGDGMELRDGRLYVQTDRGRELFSELSHGERWRIALDIAVKAVGSPGLLVVRQEAFESLDPANRRAVAEHARALGAVILTAEASDGELRAEIYSDAVQEQP